MSLYKDPAEFYGPGTEEESDSKWSGQEPEITQDSSRKDKLLWAKWRAHQEPWNVALASMMQDMDLLGIPMDPEFWQLAMMEAVHGGEKAVWDFIDGIN